MQSKNFINGQAARDYERTFPGLPNIYKEVFESKKYKKRFYELKMKKILWLHLFTRGLLFWIALNWSIFLVIDGVLVTSHMIYEKLVYKFLVLSVVSYVLALNLSFTKKLFYLKDTVSNKQLQYFLSKASLLWSVFFLFLIFVKFNASDSTLINCELFIPIPLFALFSFIISFKLKKIH